VTVQIDEGGREGPLWLGVRQGMSSVLARDRETSSFLLILDKFVKILCRRRMMPHWESEAKVMDKLST